MGRYTQPEGTTGVETEVDTDAVEVGTPVAARDEAVDTNPQDPANVDYDGPSFDADAASKNIENLDELVHPAVVRERENTDQPSDGVRVMLIANYGEYVTKHGTFKYREATSVSSEEVANELTELRGQHDEAIFARV